MLLPIKALVKKPKHYRQVVLYFMQETLENFSEIFAAYSDTLLAPFTDGAFMQVFVTLYKQDGPYTNQTTAGVRGM